MLGSKNLRKGVGGLAPPCGKKVPPVLLSLRSLSPPAWARRSWRTAPPPLPTVPARERVCVRERVRERESEGEREREGEGEGEGESERDRKRERQRVRERVRERESARARERARESEREWRERERERENERETASERERERERGRERERAACQGGSRLPIGPCQRGRMGRLDPRHQTNVRTSARTFLWRRGPSPHGGVRPKSTCHTQLTLGPYVVSIWSRYARN